MRRSEEDRGARTKREGARREEEERGARSDEETGGHCVRVVLPAIGCSVLVSRGKLWLNEFRRAIRLHLSACDPTRERVLQNTHTHKSKISRTSKIVTGGSPEPPVTPCRFGVDLH